MPLNVYYTIIERLRCMQVEGLGSQHTQKYDTIYI